VKKTLIFSQNKNELNYFKIMTFVTGHSGAKPTIASYNATGSLARFENNNILFYFEKRSSLLQRQRCSCKFKKS
jgi:hypothetical protein